MARLIGMALALIGLIAAMLAVNGLPWGEERSAGDRVAAALAAAPPPALAPLPRLRPGPVSDGDAMAVMTRQVVQGLRQAVPGPGGRVEALARQALAAQPGDAYALALRTEARPMPLHAVPLAALPPADVARLDDSAPLPRARPPGAPRFHTVIAGETLTTISERAYGRASAWEVIYAANRDRLTRPDLIPLGTVLVLPRLP